MFVYRCLTAQTDKIWAYEDIRANTYRVWWGKSNQSLQSKVITGESWKKALSKTQRGYVSVSGSIVNNRWVQSQQASTPIQPKREAKPKPSPITVSMPEILIPQGYTLEITINTEEPDLCF